MARVDVMSSRERIDELALRHGLGAMLTGRVLVVDDEADNLLVMRAFLEPDWTVLEAHSGAEALRVLETTRVDVVLTDHRMPGITGVEVLESLNRNSPDTAGILVTAYSDTPLLIQAINRAGVFRHLKKPWEADDLLAAVAQARAHVRALRTNHHLLELLSERTDALTNALGALQATQQQVLHMERLSTVGRLTAGLTHDLRNVVQGLVLLELQCDAASVPTAFRERLQLGVAGMRNLLGGLQGINQFASGGSVPLRLERVDPRQVVHDASVIASMDLAAREHPLRTIVDPGLGAIQGDRQKLIQVLVNLLRNAGEASPPRGEVVLHAYLADGGLVFSVQDTGPGVSPEVADRLFDPFVTTKGGQGVGLGLFMARLVAQSHGGQMRYALRGEGGSGARFEMWLPGVPEAADEARQATSHLP